MPSTPRFDPNRTMPIDRLMAWPFCRFASWVTPCCTPPPRASERSPTTCARSSPTCSRRWMPRPAWASPHRRSACRCASSPTATRTTTARRGAACSINPELWMTPARAGRPRPRRGVRRAACRSPASGSRCAAPSRALLTGDRPRGEPCDIEVDGWRARILQHEFDHLDGVLYVDRLTRRRLEDRAEDRPQARLGPPRPGLDAGRRRHRRLSGRRLTESLKNGPRSGVLSRSLPGLDSNQEPIG